VHPELEGNQVSYEEKLDVALDLIEQANDGEMLVIKGKELKRAIQQKNGIPVAIFERKVVL
jgi:L,D-transpeptidase ErfK/SrfK